MMANPFDQFDGAPSGTPRVVLSAPPKVVTPLEAAREARAENADDRATKAMERQASAQERQNINTQYDNITSARKEFEGLLPVKNYKVLLDSVGTAMKQPQTGAGDLAVIYAFGKANDPNSAVREGELSLAQQTASLPEYLQQWVSKIQTGQRLTPEVRHELIEAIRQKGIVAAKSYNQARDQYKTLAIAHQFNPDEVVGPHPGEPFQQLEADFTGHVIRNRDGSLGKMPAGGKSEAGTTPPGGGGGEIRFNDEMPGKSSNSYRLTPAQEDTLATLAKSGATAEQLQAKYAELKIPAPDMANLRAIADFYKDPKNRTIDPSFDYSLVDKIKPVNPGDGGQGAFARGVADSGTLGLMPRLTAVSEALRNDTRYSDELDKQRGFREYDGSQHIVPMVAGSLVGGVGIPIGLEATTPGQIARAGATVGTIYGFNSSYDSIPEKLGSAAKGGVAGLAAGYGLAKGAPALAAAYTRIANRPSVAAARTAAGVTRAEGADIAAAGQVENVPVNRAMVNPALQNRVTAAEATFGGGPIVRRSMADVARGIETRVNDLGAGGTALEPVVGGAKVQGAAERYIAQSGAVARRQYDRAEKLAGDIKVPPQEMGQAIGSIITKLNETPSINAPEIAFLKNIENDLGKNLSVGALRRFRTQLRGKISKGELTFGESEADVLAVMDAASRDIENGLRAAGKDKAAEAFHSADAAYRQRMDFIGGTIQKLIGKRNANVSPEATLARFKAMASPKGDVEGLGKMLAVMQPDEAADVAATFAAELGRNNKGEFSTAHLLSQVEKLSPSARVTIFGPDGAESLGRLVTLAKAHNRVFSQLNHSKSGVAGVARDYRSWIAGLIGVGAGSGSNAVTGIASAAGTAAAVAAKDILSARALMSPNISKWLAATPSAASAIPAHIARLGPIAAREPAIANEVVALQERLTNAFVGPNRAAAGREDRNDRRPPSGAKQPNQQPSFHMP